MADDKDKKKNKNQRLGKGLAALIGEPQTKNSTVLSSVSQPSTKELGSNNLQPRLMAESQKVPVEYITINPRNPRKSFAEEDLESLSISLKQQGMLQPILVRSINKEDQKAGTSEIYEIIAGERRWRASQRAGLHEVPIIIRELDDRESLEVAIVENVQRADLNPLEEAEGYAQLIEEFHYTQADLGDIIGKSRSHVTNMLRLMKLPKQVRDYILSGELTMGHARALVNAEDPANLAELIVSKGLSVREAERLRQKQTLGAQRSGITHIANPLIEKTKNADIKAIENDLSAYIGMPVEVRGSGTKGSLIINFNDLDQFDYLITRLKSQD